MTPSPIVLNARFVTHEITGVERFAHELGQCLLRARPDVICVAPTGAVRPEWVPEANWHVVGRLQGHAWEQIELPAYLLSVGSPVLLSLCNSGPVSYPRQVASHHDAGYLRFPGSYSWRFRSWYRVMASLLLRTARAVVTVSEFSRHEIVECFGIDPDKITVVPNAVGAQFTPDPAAERGAYALAVGSPSVRKNTARLVAAWPAVREATGVDLRIVGSELLVGSGTSTAGQDGVTFLGRVSEDDLVALYRGARLSIVPSLYEGFGLPVLESQACGCPVIASDSAALPAVVGDSGLLFDPEDGAALAAAAISVLTSPDLARELTAAGYENVRRFSWEASARRVLNAADQVGDARYDPTHVRRSDRPD